MIQIELSEPDAATLHEILESVLSDLRMEIADTDTMDFRELLKGKKRLLQKVLEQLEGTTGA